MKDLWKKVLTVFLCLCLTAGLIPVRAAEPPEDGSRAEALHSLGLLSGTGSGYDLERTATRAEGLTMLLRLTGEAEMAQAHPADHGFSDVPDWAGGYVAYGVEEGLTSGVGGGRFGSDNVITANQYATFVLRALGYGDGDFSWESAARKLYDLGVITAAQLSRWTGETFRRSDLVDLSYDALRAETKGGGTLAETLVTKELFTEGAARTAGIWPGTEALPVSPESEPLRPGTGNSPANQALGGMGAYDEENAYFVLGLDFYLVPLSGGGAVKLASMKDALPQLTPKSKLQHLNVYDGGLYFILFCYADADFNDQNDGVWRCDLTTGALTHIAPRNGNMDGFSIHDGRFYYFGYGDVEELWRMELDGSGDTLVQSWTGFDTLSLTVEQSMPGVYRRVLSNGYLYWQAPGTPVYSPVWEENIETEALARTSIADGTVSVLCPVKIDPPGGGEGAHFWQYYNPIPDGGWVYYLEDHQKTATQKNMHSPYGVSGIWRMRPDGSEKELLYENRSLEKDPTQYGADNIADWAKELTDEQYSAAYWQWWWMMLVENYTVCDGSVVMIWRGNMQGDGMADFQTTSIVKVEDGALKQLYATPDPIEMPGSLYHEAGTVSNIENLFTTPGWIFFTRSDDTLRWVSQEGDSKTGKVTHVQAVYRVRPDGTGLERVTPEISY